MCLCIDIHIHIYIYMYIKMGNSDLGLVHLDSKRKSGNDPFVQSFSVEAPPRRDLGLGYLEGSPGMGDGSGENYCYHYYCYVLYC